MEDRSDDTWRSDGVEAAFEVRDQIVGMFDADGEDRGLEWADPVSCLLALHDARLEAQVQELVDAFESGRARGATADPA